MPRWLVAVLFSLCALLWWTAHRGSASMAATANAIGADQACRVLQVPPVLDDTSQSEQSAPPFRMGAATMTPLAAFSVAARVLSREDYHFGPESAYSPTDLALGWGPMSAPDIAERLHISQGGRWYRYRWDSDGPPIAPAEIVRNSANMHMVPANVAITGEIASLRPGALVRLDGWLLRIDGDDGWRWQSSLSRDDVGAGSCELLLVCSVRER